MSNLQKAITAGLMHGIVIENKADYKQTGFAKKLKLNGVFENSISVNGLSMRQPMHRYIPYLFPMSSLIKEIEFGGERFVPLHILFGILCSSNYVGFEEIGAIIDFQIDDEWNHCMTMRNFDQELCFSYDNNTGAFMLMIDGECEFVSYQQELFDKLDEWHFNRRNISPDQFIEVNEDNNPYK